MKYIFIIILVVFNCFIAFSQDLIVLKKKSKNIVDLIPKNWKIIDSTTQGDLNDDGINDLVIIIRKEDQTNFIINNEIGASKLDINPKVLGVYFRDNKGCLMKQLQHNTFIYVNKNPTMEEPFQDMEITQNGLLKLDFQEFYNAGSWYVNNESYFFKYTKGSFQLVQHATLNLHRATMESIEEHTDFIKGEITNTKETFEEDDEENENPIVKSEKTTFKPTKLNLLKDLDVPFLFAEQ